MTFQASHFTEIKALLNRPVVLVGMMGTGKTSIGRRLAHHLGYEFLDSDHAVEEKAGLSVAEIFQQYGEAKFRAAEKTAIFDLLKHTQAVIATGGGAVTQEDIREALKERAVTIWLQASPEQLYERVKHNANRPLLQQDDPLAVLARLSEERAELYAQSDIHVDLNGQDAAKALETVSQGLFDYLKSAKL